MSFVEKIRNKGIKLVKKKTLRLDFGENFQVVEVV